MNGGLVGWLGSAKVGKYFFWSLEGNRFEKENIRQSLNIKKQNHNKGCHS